MSSSRTHRTLRSRRWPGFKSRCGSMSLLTALEAGVDGLDVVRALLSAADPGHGVRRADADRNRSRASRMRGRLCGRAHRLGVRRGVSRPQPHRARRSPAAYLTQPQLGEDQDDGEEKQPRCERLLDPLRDVGRDGLEATLQLGRAFRDEVALARRRVRRRRRTGRR